MAGTSKAWRGGELTRAEVTYRVLARRAGRDRGRSGAQRAGCRDRRSSVDLTLLAPIRREIENLRHRVEQVHGFAIVEPPAALRGPQRRALAWLIGRLLGEPTEQSREGVKVIEVYDRDRRRRMADGARYHQTRQGGSLHTDNVNRPQTWDYLMMACVAPAMLGGESIIVSGRTVHDLLRAARAARARGAGGGLLVGMPRLLRRLLPRAGAVLQSARRAAVPLSARVSGKRAPAARRAVARRAAVGARYARCRARAVGNCSSAAGWRRARSS